jgi:hypothetical protein
MKMSGRHEKRKGGDEKKETQRREQWRRGQSKNHRLGDLLHQASQLLIHPSWAQVLLALQIHSLRSPAHAQ